MIDAEEEIRTETVEITFPAGLPGFPHSHHFQLEAWGEDETPFSIMTSVEDPDLGFVVAQPWLFYPEYEFDLDEGISQRLGLDGPGDALVLCVLTLHDRPELATINLLGPIVINRYTHEACQAVLDPSLFNVSAPLARRGL